ncbi:hypothetical protein Tco_0025803 [Tanacetum coccineum]
MRLRTKTKTLEDLCSHSLETASQAIHDAITTHQVTASQHFMTVSAHTDSNADLEDSTYDGPEKEKEKARTTLLMALPEDHLAKFHKMTDVKEMWEAIKSRFGGNDESKKMQKYMLKKQFKGVYTEDANLEFLSFSSSAWYQVSLIMRTKPGMDSLSFDDLYNNLRVFENDVKGSTASSTSTQNVAFVSGNTSSTNDVGTAYGVSNTTGHNSQNEHTSSYLISLQINSVSINLDHGRFGTA